MVNFEIVLTKEKQLMSPKNEMKPDRRVFETLSETKTSLFFNGEQESTVKKRDYKRPNFVHFWVFNIFTVLVHVVFLNFGGKMDWDSYF